ncbi:MAG: aminotransferase class I/II-fold pyridoxal phosphate-dependent enzyme [Anaerolineales bacterium]|jgi:aspartate/methionine/tyrosine aminotransferase
MHLPPFELERYFARYEFSTPYTLCSSDSESVAVGDLLALEPDARAAINRHWLGYTESQGAPSLRAEISRLYQTIRPDQVLVCSGAEEAIFLFMNAALEPGDHAIVHGPRYQSLSAVAQGIGCEVTDWMGREADGWALDLEDLRGEIRPATRVVVVNTPHNPTGYLMSGGEFRELAACCDRTGAVLFSDEVYHESEYDPAQRLPMACDLSERAVSLGVMSKTYGLPGLRIGWIATRNAELHGRMARLKDYTTICNSAPSEFLAEVALRHRPDLVRRNLDIIAANLSVLDEFFARHPDRFSWVRPRAGPIAFPRLLGEEVGIFCDRLAADAGVLLLPGTVYGDRDNHFRIGFGRKNLPEAVARLEGLLSSRPS